MVKTKRFRLRDGRFVAWDEYGAPDGIPVIHMHGTPSARIEPAMFGLPEICESLGIRLIAPDRPGVGLSDIQPCRTILDWPTDLAELTDHIGIDRFQMLGYSGGGVYTLATALRMPERVEWISIVSGTAPFDLPEITAGINENSFRFMRMSVEKPVVAGLMVSMMALTARFVPDRVASQARQALPAPDADLMRVDENGREFARMVREAARSGHRGPRHETALMVSPWGFEINDIQTPVHVWHGDVDRNAPIAMGRYLASNLPNATPHFIENEGHLSLLKRYAREILANHALIAGA